MFEITTIPHLHMLKARLDGFWSDDIARAFVAEERRAVAVLPCSPGEHVLMCDLRELDVLPQDLLPFMAANLNSDGPGDARRIAIVCRSSLLRMQVSRITKRGGVRTFAEASEAEAWLSGAEGEP